MKDFFTILQGQGLFSLFIFGIGFSVVILGLISMVLAKLGIIRFGRASCRDKTIQTDETVKQLIRDQSAQTRKVVYEMKQGQEIHQAVMDNTIEHFEKSVDKLVNVLSEVQQDISKFLRDKKNGKG